MEKKFQEYVSYYFRTSLVINANKDSFEIVQKDTLNLCKYVARDRIFSQLKTDYISQKYLNLIIKHKSMIKKNG